MATATHTVDVQCDSSGQYDVELQRVIDAGFTILTSDAENYRIVAEKTVTD
tara:strand:+ start:13982 stop:14134 length:153 start_codon:yes stop_codon:yes gene_type:complete